VAPLEVGALPMDAPLAGAPLAGADVPLVLELELQAATPAIKQAAKATACHRAVTRRVPACLVSVRRRMLVKRAIAPSAFLRFAPSCGCAFLRYFPRLCSAPYPNDTGKL
jgi:hypothetical protein